MNKQNANVRSVDFQVNYTLTQEAIADVFANGLWMGQCGFDDIDFDKGDYEEAKNELIYAQGMDEELVCAEDVEAKMLLMGKTIRLHMAEEREDEEWYDLTLDKLIEGVKKYGEHPINGSLRDVLEGDPDCKLDATDYDAILQYACFGEVLIG